MFKFFNNVEPNGKFFKTSDGDDLILTINKKLGSIFGSIKTMNGRSYGIEMCSNGYVLKEFDLAAFPQEITFSVNQTTIGSLQKTSVAERNNKVVTYSVMFYYTPQFAAITQDINGYIDQVLAETNQGYINSNIPIRCMVEFIKVFSSVLH